MGLLVTDPANSLHQIEDQADRHRKEHRKKQAVTDRRFDGDGVDGLADHDDHEERHMQGPVCLEFADKVVFIHSYSFRAFQPPFLILQMLCPGSLNPLLKDSLNKSALRFTRAFALARVICLFSQRFNRCENRHCVRTGSDGDRS